LRRNYSFIFLFSWQSKVPIGTPLAEAGSLIILFIINQRMLANLSTLHNSCVFFVSPAFCHARTLASPRPGMGIGEEWAASVAAGASFLFFVQDAESSVSMAGGKRLHGEEEAGDAAVLVIW
jgi:hypothetical protein